MNSRPLFVAPGGRTRRIGLVKTVVTVAQEQVYENESLLNGFPGSAAFGRIVIQD